MTILSRIDDTLANRCACGCGQPTTVSAWYATEDCQRRYHSARAHNPDQVSSHRRRSPLRSLAGFFDTDHVAVAVGDGHRVRRLLPAGHRQCGSDGSNSSWAVYLASGRAATRSAHQCWSTKFRCVVTQADPVIWLSAELVAHARDPNRSRVTGDLDIDGDLVSFGVEGEELCRLTYRIVEYRAESRVYVAERVP